MFIHTYIHKIHRHILIILYIYVIVKKKYIQYIHTYHVKQQVYITYHAIPIYMYACMYESVYVGNGTT